MYGLLLKTLKENGEQDYVSFVNHNKFAIKEFPELEFETLEGILKQEDVVALNNFIKQGFDINVRNKQNETVLHTSMKVSVEFVEKMIKKGANIFALDITGMTPLLRLFQKDKNVELQDFYMSKGVNPRSTTFCGRNAFNYLMAQIKQNPLVKERQEQLEGLYPKLKNFATLVNEGEHELALSLLTGQIQNLGGIQFVLDRIDEPKMFNLLLQLQGAYIRLNMTAEANQVLKAVMSLSHVPAPSMQRIEYFSVIPALTEGDEDTLFGYLDYLYKLNKKYKHKKENLISYMYMISKIVGNESKIVEYQKLYKKIKFEEGYCLELLQEVVFTNSEEVKPFLLDELKGHIDNTSHSTRAELLLILGCYYLSEGDLVSAEVLLQRSINFGKEVIFNITPYTNCAFGLCQYIHTLN